MVTSPEGEAEVPDSGSALSAKRTRNSAVEISGTVWDAFLQGLPETNGSYKIILFGNPPPSSRPEHWHYTLEAVNPCLSIKCRPRYEN